MQLQEKLQRLKEGRSYSEIAKKIGCSPENVRKIIDQGTEPKFLLGVRLAQVLGADIEWLADEQQGFPIMPTRSEEIINKINQAIDGAGLAGELDPLERQVITGLRQMSEPQRQRVAAYLQGLIDSALESPLGQAVKDMSASPTSENANLQSS